MKLIQGKRQSGKTTTLIHLSSSLEIPITVSGSFQVKYIKEVAETLGVLIPEPMIFNVQSIRGRKEVLIDDLDSIKLGKIINFGVQLGRLGVKIPFATYTVRNDSVEVMGIITNIPKNIKEKETTINNYKTYISNKTNKTEDSGNWMEEYLKNKERRGNI